MNYSPLYNLIKSIEYGTKLHIGVLFFENFGNELCKLPREQKIHHSPMCNFFKTKNKDSYSKCFRCSTFVVSKVLKTKKPFHGICINGIFEYTYPVILNDKVVCIIFIGNIYCNEKSPAKIKNSNEFDSTLINSLEPDFSLEQCQNICNVIEDYILHLLNKPQGNTITSHILIENIKNYISSNSEFNISIIDIAKMFHYNPSYLGRLFKKETGLSCNEYINLCRIRKAKYRLSNTNLNCVHISTEIGFNNITYFNRMFKNHTNMTPLEYRTSFKKTHN